jgi:serine/threonine protein kinase/uncharacterized membrane protein
MEELLGKTLDDVYRIDQVIGRGGMGSVYQARDTSLDRDVAIKILHRHFTDDEAFRARFLQEARAIASLDHSGIVRVHAFGQDRGLLYIVMDLVAGQTLQEWLKRLADEGKIVALTESLTIVRHVAWALHYAHEEGVLHRDVKPANILLKPTPPALREPGALPFYPVLTDFGLAKIREGGVHTQTGTTMGTPAYMSPEQCLGLEPDRRSDIYSLGVVLFELTTGRVPFEVKSLTEAIRCHTQEPPPPPRAINPTLPVEVENIVLRALAKRQEDRFASGREMVDALRSAIPRVPAGLKVAPTHASEPLPYVSLMTRLAQEEAGRQGPGAAAWEESEPAAPVGSSLILVSPGGQSRRVALGGKRAVTIGRAESNDLCLPDSQVSRRHARVEFSGQRFTVMDLDSTNGTFLGDSRLLPGVAEVWGLGKPLRVGEHVLRLEWEPQQPSREVGRDRATEVGLGAGRPGLQEERIGVSIDGFERTVEPGGSASLSFSIQNQGTVVDHFQTSVEGIPAGWVPGLPPVIRLLPGEQHEVRLAIQPPRSPESRAGRYPTTVHITSQDAPDQVASVRGTLVVAPYYQFDLGMRPQKQAGVGEGTFEVRLSNQGNAEVTVLLEATDAEEGCRYVFDPPRPVVPPGQERAVQLKVRSKAPLSGGLEKIYAFTVTARPAEAAELARHVQGQWVQITPTFEVSLRPQRQSGVAEGRFQVRVANPSVVALEVQLEALDPEDGCTYAFDSPQLSVPAGQERTAQLSVRPRLPLPGETARTFEFTVTARSVEAPAVARQAQGQWVQIVPAFEIDVRPQRQEGAARATFSVQITNSSVADLEVQLEAADAEEACLYTFAPAQASVPAARERSVQLVVQSRKPPRGKEPQPQPFTVTARPQAAPRSVRQVEAEWVETPRSYAVGPPLVLALAGWVVAWATFWLPVGNFLYDVGKEWLLNAGLPWKMASAAPWALHGLIVGLIGGGVTGIALHWFEPSFRWSQVLGTTIAWMIGWAVGLASAPLTEIPFNDMPIPALFWAAVGGVVGLLNGSITGGALRRASQAFRGGHMLLVVLGWVAAWGIAETLVEWLVHQGSEYYLSDGWLYLTAILGGLGGLIGCAVMFGQLGRARRGASEQD